MKTIVITSENGETFSSISNFFIDYHMTQANGEFVKIYLYLIRLLQAGRSIDIQDIADHFQCTQKDICRAIRYWVDRNLLQLEYNQKNELIGITVLHPPVPDSKPESDTNSGLDLLNKPTATITPFPVNSMGTSSKETTAGALQQSASEAAVIPEKKNYTATQIRSLGRDEQMESILYQFEMYWGHTPTNTEYQTLLYIYEQLEFPADLLEYLIEYCASLERTSHRYMEKVAIDWYSRQIRTAKKAKEETSAYHALNNAITRELGLNRVLTPTELRYINTWKNDYSFQQDIIIEACQRASENNKITFRYIDRILANWYENQVKTLEDVRCLDEAHKMQKNAQNEKANTSAGKTGSNKVQNLPFNNFKQRNYDNEELENFFIDEVQKLSEES